MEKMEKSPQQIQLDAMLEELSEQRNAMCVRSINLAAALALARDEIAKLKEQLAAKSP